MLGTIVVGGFWVASAIYVGGLTWRAFTDTYSKFPDTAADVVTPLSKVSGQGIGEGLLSKIPLVGGALESAAQFLGSSTGTEANLNPTQINRLRKLPPPPARIVSQLKRYVGPTMNPDTVGSANQAMATKALEELLQWGTAHGYAKSDVGAYLTLIFPHSTWPNLH